jgi:hypothetical protein
VPEQWKSIPGYEGSYEASNLGRIRALDRITDRGRKWKGQMMTPATMPRGYQVVTLWRGGKKKTALVHRLVLFAFVGPAPEDTEALHGNGNPADNSLGNLSWGTHSENQLDQVSHGTHVNASKDSCPAGHPYDDANTYFYPGGPHRACRQCRRENLRRWTAANPERAREISAAAMARYRAKKLQEAS